MNTKGIRDVTGLTQKELADKFDIPLGTVQNWDARNCMPSYVYNMMIASFKMEDKINDLEHVIEILKQTCLG